MWNMKTPKGTELPLLPLGFKGKEKPYLQVAHRIVWFREEHPEWLIRTTFIEHTPDYTFCKAEIYDENDKLRAMAHKRETIQDFKDHMEKAETSSIGRALALLGYGTQFAPDLQEGDRLADSPIDPAKQNGGKQADKPSETFPHEVARTMQLAEMSFPDDHKKFPKKTFREVVTTTEGMQYAIYFAERPKTPEGKDWPVYVRKFMEYSQPFINKEFGK